MVVEQAAAASVKARHEDGQALWWPYGAVKVVSRQPRVAGALCAAAGCPCPGRRAACAWASAQPGPAQGLFLRADRSRRSLARCRACESAGRVVQAKARAALRDMDAAFDEYLGQVSMHLRHGCCVACVQLPNHAGVAKEARVSAQGRGGRERLRERSIQSP